MSGGEEDRVTVSRSVRVNLGNYEGTEVFISQSEGVEDGDDRRAVAAQLLDAVSEALLDQVRSITKARGQRATDDELRRRYGLARPREPF